MSYAILKNKTFLLIGVGLASLIGLLFFANPALATSPELSIDLESGSSQYLSVVDSSALDLSTSGTLEAWVNFESLPSYNADYKFVSKWNSSSNDRSYLFDLENTAGTYNLIFGVSSSGGGGSYSGHSVNWTPETDVWYHVAATYNAGTVKLYVDGDQVGSDGSVSSSIYDGASDFIVGSQEGGTSAFFDGLIDDVRVWSDVRTEAEIEDNMFEALTGSESNLVGYWDLNGTTTDQTSNGNDLTENNGPSYSSEPPHSIICTLPTTIYKDLDFSLDISCSIGLLI